MPTCPICAKPLETIRHREGLYYVCVFCRGRALSIPHVRKVGGDRLATRLLRLLKLGARHSARPCPFCTKPMVVAFITEPLLETEGCLACNAVWMDGPTFENLSSGVVETTNSLGMQSTEIYAEIKLKELKDREKEEAEKARKKKKRSKDL